jgi:hypothetical protein
MSRPSINESAPIIFGKPVNTAWLIPVPACGSPCGSGQRDQGCFPGRAHWPRIGRSWLCGLPSRSVPGARLPHSGHAHHPGQADTRLNLLIFFTKPCLRRRVDEPSQASAPPVFSNTASDRIWVGLEKSTQACYHPRFSPLSRKPSSHASRQNQGKRTV